MAARWHPNDHRKIRRSLEIYYLNGGMPASEIYRLQKPSEKKNKEKKDESVGEVARFRNLIFWVHAEPEVLNKRLEGRVDKMVSEGLFDEIEELWGWYLSLKEGEKEVDWEKGVWQSIGFKEFLPWLQARREAGLGELKGGEKVVGEGEKVVEGEVGEMLEMLRRKGLERMKIGTIQYARTQVKWIRIKLVNAVREANEEEEMDGEEGEGKVGREELQQGEANSQDTPCIGSAEDPPEGSRPKQPSNLLYLLDSSDISHFTEYVSKPAISIAKSFLSPFAPDSHPLPDPLSLSDLAASCLKPKRDYDLSRRPDLWVKRTCEVCGITTVDEESWKQHEGSGKHKRKVRGRGKWEEAQGWRERRERGEVGGGMSVEGSAVGK